MSSLGLKLYYLRTRRKQVTQMAMAKELGIRQATISNLEQDISQPSLPLLRVLCGYFDVSPSYLLDDEGPLDPSPTERWSKRHELVSVGQYLEVGANAIHELPDGNRLVAILPGLPVYDEEAAKQRAKGDPSLADAHTLQIERKRRQEQELRQQLENERRASRLRRRGVSRDQAESIGS
jgi:transcriptional regulator with XRE-family HTH domain